MARNDIISKLYQKRGTALDFNYDMLTAPPIASLIPIKDLEYMNKIITSVKYTSKIDFKEAEIKKVMQYNGWKRFASGTHRVVYRHLDFPTIVAKISLNKSSLGDNLREMYNQQFLRPFCTKVFDVYPNGMIATFERVEPFQSRDEFISVAGDIFDFINEKIVGKYVVDDIGTESYMNYGIRKVGPYSDIAFGPVLLDFPEVYPLDGNKLYCNNVINGFICNGVLDYDEGFNVIKCKHCGRIYEARELQKAIENNEIIKKGEQDNMKLIIKRGDTIISEVDSRNQATDIIEPPKKNSVAPSSQMSIICGKAVGRGHKNPPTKKLTPIEDKTEEIKNIFCGGYKKVEPVEEPATENVEEQNEQQEPISYDTDTKFIPPAEDTSEEANANEEVSDENTDEELSDTDDAAEDISEEANTNEEASEENTDEELSDADDAAEDELVYSSDETNEDVNAEDELSQDIGGDEELSDIDIDPAAIAESMMRPDANPFAAK